MPMAEPIRIVPTTDSLRIAEMAREIWWAHYPPIIGEEQVKYMLDRFYALPALQQQMDDGQCFLRIDVEDIPVGFFAYSRQSAGVYFIHKWYISSAFQGKGIGRKVFALWREMCGDVAEVRLQVNRYNRQAILFYEGLGFARERELKVDIGGGFFMDDYVMRYTSVGEAISGNVA